MISLQQNVILEKFYSQFILSLDLIHIYEYLIHIYDSENFADSSFLHKCTSIFTILYDPIKR